MRERLIKLGVLTLGSSIALSACGQETKPSEGTINIEQAMQDGVTITEQNFDQFFTKCSSKDELIKTARQEGREIFPILIDNPSDLKIIVQPARIGSHSLDLITANKPLTYIAPVSGPIIGSEDVASQNGDFTVILQVQDTGIIDSVDKEGGNKKAEIEIQLKPDANKTIYKNVGDKANQGDPLFTFISSGAFADSGIENSFALGKVEYSGNNAGYYSSDLSTYATLNGKILYCSPNEIPVPNQSGPQA